MMARETKRPSPAAEAPGWNGWNSRSAEDMPGPLSEMRITTELSREYAATRIRPSGVFSRAPRLFVVKFKKTWRRPERFARTEGSDAGNSHSELIPASPNEGEII